MPVKTLVQDGRPKVRVSVSAFCIRERCQEMFDNLSIDQRGKEEQSMPSALSPRVADLVVLLLFLFLIAGDGRASSQGQQGEISPEQQKVSVGSLSSVGEVYVNDSLAPSESTIFPGDSVRIGQSGAATFTVSGRGSLKVSPQSRVVFSGNYQFIAELEAGTVVLNSIAGGNGMILRIGGFVLVPSFPREQSITSKVERNSDGSFIVSCFDGSAGILTLEGRSGQFLHGGQSLQVSSNKPGEEELSLVSTERHRPKSALDKTPPERFLLGLAGAGGVASAIDQLIQSRGKQSISPSAP